MKRALLALWVAGSAHAPVQAQLHPDGLRLLDVWLQAQQRYQQLPALSVAVQEGSQPLWSRGYGVADRAGQQPATGRTVYGICSISKVFTATAVMQQVEQGLYALDDDMARLLPHAGLPAATPQHGAVTVRSLLTHAGGLGREAPFPYWEPPGFRFPSREQLLRQPPERLDAPRQHLHYSNHGMALLGELVATKGGMPYGDWVQQRLLTPLGLSATRPTLRGTPVAQGWSALQPDGRRQPVAAYDAQALAPSAGFSSSVEDLVRFARWQFALLSGTGEAGVLSPASVREMLRLQFQDPQDKRQRGLAWRLTDDEGERVAMHDGHCPGQVSLLALQPAQQLALAFAVNAHAPAWIDDYLGRPARKILNQSRSLPRDATGLADYAGRYDDPPWSSEVWVLPWGAELLMLSLPTNDPMGDASRYARVERDAFRAVRGDGSLGEWLRFERDAQGRVVRAVLSHQGMRRVE